MKKILVVALALVMCFALTAVASAKTYELKISTTQTDSSMIYQGLKAAADEIMEKTNGDVKVTIYPSSQLGGEEDMIDQAIAGIGVALAAPVAIGDHMIAIPGVMPGWDGFDIVSPLSATFNTPVYVDNDANYAAYCESRMGAAIGKRDFVYISTNDNVGAGIVAGGEIMHGVTGLAGEIGHIQVDPLGAICSCGNRGCLNTIVAENRLVQLLSVTHGNMTMDDLVAQANNGDPGCRRIIADTAVRIGQVAADLCISIDPEVVVVGGKLAMAGEVFTQPFNEALQRLLFPDAVMPITVLSSPHPSDNCALGGALAAIGHAIRNSIAA